MKDNFLLWFSALSRLLNHKNDDLSWTKQNKLLKSYKSHRIKVLTVFDVFCSDGEFPTFLLGYKDDTISFFVVMMTLGTSYEPEFAEFQEIQDISLGVFVCSYIRFLFGCVFLS